MRTAKSAVCLGILCLVALGSAAWAQDSSKPAQAGAAAAMPALPRPGAEQAIFSSDVGVWDATVEMFMEPGAPPVVSQGVETNVLSCGGLCLISDFKSEMMGAAFSGHGITAYDAVKKKYVGIWMDSMSLAPSHSESTFDPAKKVMSCTMEGPDMSGTIVKSRSTVEWRGADSRVMSMFSCGTDGKDVPSMRITYKRRQK